MQWLEKNSMHFSAASSTTRTIRRHRASPHSTYTTVSTDDSIISSRKKFACFWKGRLGVCGASKASYRDAFKVSTSIWEPRKKYQCTVGINQCKLWHRTWLFLNISYSMSSNFWISLCVKTWPILKWVPPTVYAMAVASMQDWERDSKGIRMKKKVVNPPTKVPSRRVTGKTSVGEDL